MTLPTKNSPSYKAFELIKQWEGFKPDPYKCKGGKTTIGYGHAVKDTELDYIGPPINSDQAERLLKEDVMYLSRYIGRLNLTLNQNQFDSIVTLIYNIGIGSFKNSTMLKHIEDKNYGLAAKEFDRWIYIKGKKCKGLINRRAAERRLFEGI